MRQSCKACGRPDKFDFRVPDDVWSRVVGPTFEGRVVCLYCFDELAREAGVAYAHCLETLYFAGDCAALVFQSVSATDLTDSSPRPV